MSVQPMSCAEVVRQLWDWLDHELPDTRWDAIERHLATCTGCTEHMQFARDFLVRVHRTRTPPGDDLSDLRSRVHAALRPGP